MVEAVTVRRDRIRPVSGLVLETTAAKFFDIKILPASDSSSRIFHTFPANVMIPIDRGGGGIPRDA
jgi:hypothetical protein